MLGWLMWAGLALADDTPEAAWLRSVLERPWDGVGVQQTSATTSGQLVMSHTLTWKGDATMQLSGTFTTQLIFDGVTYRATYAIRGDYLPTTQQIAVRATVTRGDPLPGGGHFCGFTGTLQVGNDAKRPGHYAIWGPATPTCDGSTVTFQLVDRAPDPAPTTVPPTP